MSLKRSVFTFTLAVALVVSQGYGGADAKAQEPRDSRGSIQAARQSVTSIFSSLLDSILEIRSGNSPSITPQYKLAFSVGAGGKVVNTASGFECESDCEVALTDVLRATYEVIPYEDYQFAGWSGDVCNEPETRLNSACQVTIGWSALAADEYLSVKARFARKADTGLAGNTKEFEVSNYGFGSFFTNEKTPKLCYPTLDDCDSCGMGCGIAYHVPDNTAQGDFNRDGFEDILIMSNMPYGYVRQQKVYPTIFLNDQNGGLYRSDSIFAEGEAIGMDFGYRLSVTDFNGDGFDDFLVGAMGTLSREPHNYMESVFERYILYLSGPDGKLYDRSDQIEGQENGAILPDMGSHYMATGDIDGDGDIDAWQWPGILINDGEGNFTHGDTYASLCDCWDGILSSLIADFDGDDIGDLAVFQSTPDSLARLFISRGASSLSDRQMKTLPTGKFDLNNTVHNHAAAADIDNDGDIDIVVGQTRSDPYYKGRYLQLLLNDGQGNFSDVSDERLGDQSIYFEGDRPPGGEGFVTLLDVNNDGHVDIFDRRDAVPPKDGFPLQASASIWLNDGRGYFSDVPPTVFPTVEPKHLAPRYGNHWQVQGMLWAAPIHLNDDGQIDIVSYVLTDADTRSEGEFWESTLYTLTAKKKLEAGNYAD